MIGYSPAGTVRTMYVHCTYIVPTVRTMYVHCTYSARWVSSHFTCPIRTTRAGVTECKLTTSLSSSLSFWLVDTITNPGYLRLKPNTPQISTFVFSTAVLSNERRMSAIFVKVLTEPKGWQTKMGVDMFRTMVAVREEPKGYTMVGPQRFTPRLRVNACLSLTRTVRGDSGITVSDECFVSILYLH